YLTADGVDITGTNNLNLDGKGQFTGTGGNIALVSIYDSIFASQGTVRILGSIITNSAGQYYIIATNGMNVLTAGPLFLNADQVNLIGTNSVSVQSSGQTSLSGRDVYVTGLTNLFLGSGNGKVHLTGVTITNYAGHYDIISTNGVSVLTAGSMFLNSDNANLIATNGLNLQSLGLTSINGRSVDIIGTTNLLLAAQAGPITNVASGNFGIKATQTYIDGNLFQTNGRVQLNGGILTDIRSGNTMNVQADGTILVDAGAILSLKGTTSTLLTGSNNITLDSPAIKLRTSAVKASTAVVNQVPKLVNTDG